ncbi:hypothetical protein [Oryzobacter telluris]|uniref:hypothetical protein n=1 Tax=Oryzobacter telluris TaxID=3149179 RepID=UPI00370D057D
MGEARRRQSTTAGHESAESLRGLGQALASLLEAAGSGSGPSSIDGLLRFGQSRAVGARWGSVVLQRQGRFHTLASTGETAAAIDSTQFRAGRGPAIDAMLEGGTVLTADVSEDERWQPLGRGLRERIGVRSMVAYRLDLLDGDEEAAALCFSSDRVDAFSRHDVNRACSSRATPR